MPLCMGVRGGRPPRPGRRRRSGPRPPGRARRAGSRTGSRRRSPGPGSAPPGRAAAATCPRATRSTVDRSKTSPEKIHVKPRLPSSTMPTTSRRYGRELVRGVVVAEAGQSAADQSVRCGRAVPLAEVVEADRRQPVRAQGVAGRARLGQETQRVVAEAAARHRPQLLLDGLDRLAPAAAGGGVSATGKWVVYQPTVRDRSRSSNSSSRPCPSRPSTSPAGARPLRQGAAEGRDQHVVDRVRYTGGTRCSSASVSSRPRRTSTVCSAAVTLRPPGWSTGSAGAVSGSTERQWSISWSRAPERTCAVRRSAHCW